MKNCEEITEGVYRVTMGRSNVYLLVGDDLTLVDTGLPGEEQTILESIKRVGRKPEEVNHILLTHAHMDHMGSLSALKKITGAKTVASAGEVDYVRGVKKTWTMGREGFGGKLFKAALCVMETFVFNYEPSDVEIACQGEETIAYFKGIGVVATPGHSPGSLSYYQKERGILFTGDALSGVPELRLPPRPGCADYSSALRSVERLSELDFEYCFFGHGNPLTGKASEKVRALLGNK